MLNLPLGPVMLDVEGLQLLPHEIKILQNPAVGGVILFARNYESKAQVSALTEEIHKIRSPQLLIAVDQEGGRVQRFKDDFIRLPPMATLGKRYAEDKVSALSSARSIGRVMARELVDCGIDFSFAPVLDLAEAPSAVIGDRAFEGSPQIITALATELIAGMRQAGMKSTGKHFPGHGNVIADSHLETPVDPRSLEEIRAKDMQPFAALSKQLDAVMTAHIHYPAVDADLPTFSALWIKQILRTELGFDGVVFSDDLSMHGALVVGDIEQRTQKAISAGCDMVLVCNAPEQARRALAVCGELSSDSHRRLLAMQKTPGLSSGLASSWQADIQAVEALV